MTIFEQQLKVVRLLRAVLPFAESHERPGIRAMLRRHQIRLALMALRSQLESAVDGPFDKRVSRKLDAIEVLLNE